MPQSGDIGQIHSLDTWNREGGGAIMGKGQINAMLGEGSHEFICFGSILMETWMLPKMCYYV